ncbi:unnamed protein product [Trichogramma brassicae]|uniref:ZP domain-containing protein n=1 Tax=Trichogramma brassicae TaxID=86971 RepID=A0A6H5J2C9_9HYME|nr:unnamed protein product [Trichogramma brassicae]
MKSFLGTKINQMMQFLWAVLLTSSWTIRSEALYAYECGTQISNLTVVSLTEVGECEIKEPEVKRTQIYAQLLQINNYNVIHVYECTIRVTRQVHHCGMHSHQSVVKDGMISYYKELSHDECLGIHHTTSYTGYNTILKDIPRNGTKSLPMTFAGTLDSTGACSNAVSKTKQ